MFSQGFICPKGSTLKQLHDDPDRIRRPLVKRDGALVEVGWDEAFAEIEARLLPILLAPALQRLQLRGPRRRLVRQTDRHRQTARPLVTGLDEVVAACAPFTPEAGADACGVPAEDIRALARGLAGAPTGCV